jgi:hypothetical protein
MPRTKPKRLTREEVKQELPEAEAELQGSGGWEWLFTERRLYKVAMVMAAVSERFGQPISDDTVRRWFSRLPRTETYGSQLGMWANRDDLVVFFARHQIGRDG